MKTICFLFVRYVVVSVVYVVYYIVYRAVQKVYPYTGNHKLFTLVLVLVLSVNNEFNATASRAREPILHVFCVEQILSLLPGGKKNAHSNSNVSETHMKTQVRIIYVDNSFAKKIARYGVQRITIFSFLHE